MPKFGTRLKNKRRAQKLSVSALSKLAKVPKPTLYRLEQGHNSPRIETCARLAQALGCTVDDLLAPEPKRRAAGVHR